MLLNVVMKKDEEKEEKNYIVCLPKKVKRRSVCMH
jgi:hypothetical protein